MPLKPERTGVEGYIPAEGDRQTLDHRPLGRAVVDRDALDRHRIGDSQGDDGAGAKRQGWVEVWARRVAGAQVHLAAGYGRATRLTAGRHLGEQVPGGGVEGVERPSK